MSAAIQDLAEAVKTTLNTASAASAFVVRFTAVRSYKPQYTLEQLATLRVTVIGRKMRPVIESRGGWIGSDYEIDILVQQKMNDAESNTEADRLSQLVQEIGDYFADHAVTGRGETLTAIDTDLYGQADFSTAHYLTQRAFSGGVTLTFRGFR